MALIAVALIIYGLKVPDSGFSGFSCLLGGLLFGFLVGFGQGVTKAFESLTGKPVSDEDLTALLERIL